jgi:ParB-like chromosome segregation protein Spo0J
VLLKISRDAQTFDSAITALSQISRRTDSRLIHLPIQQRQKSLPDPIFRLVDPTTLRPHPLNFSIYGDAEDVSNLVELIRASEWVRPLVINQHNNIISGHQRCIAVQILGWKTVPVEIRDFVSEEAELEALLLENANREKTPEQKVREAEAWERVERAKAKQRQQLAPAMTNQKLGRETHETLVENFPQASKGKSRDKVAKLVGLGSGRTYAKGNPSSVTLRFFVL